MSLDKLTSKIQPSEIQWRIQSAKNGKTTVVPYLTNRCVMERFDEQFGAMNWSNNYEKWGVKGVKCGISARIDSSSEWVTKYDGADETNIEATKGGFSDSMKRAAVQWGLGRDLYDYPMIQFEGESKYIPRNIEKELSDIARGVSNGTIMNDYVLAGSGKIPNKKSKPELTPENKDKWEKAIDFLVSGKLISEIEASYALTEVNKKLLMESALNQS